MAETSAPPSPHGGALDSLLKEHRRFPPPAPFAAAAHVDAARLEAMHARAARWRSRQLVVMLRRPSANQR